MDHNVPKQCPFPVNYDVWIWKHYVPAHFLMVSFFFNVQTATFRGTLLHCDPKIHTKHQQGFVELEFFACMSGRDRDAGASGCGVCVCDCSCGVCFVLSRLQGSAAVWRLWWWQQQRLLVQPLHPGGAPGGMVRLQQQTPRTSQK